MRVRNTRQGVGWIETHIPLAVSSNLTATTKNGSGSFTSNEPLRFPGFDFRQWGLSSKENDMLPAKA
jgi:hypothetical protein